MSSASTGAPAAKPGGKKGAAPEPKLLLGKVSHHLKCGIVGLPNVGKSTLFNILTKMNIPAENFPFCTIEPNESRVVVPDERYDWLVQHWKPASAVQAFLQIFDIAGLVRGASEGEGLGNAFLSHIRGVDGIFHVVRGFEDSEVVHVEGNVDPLRDLDIITRELRLKDLELTERDVEGLEKIIAREKNRRGELDTKKKVVELLKAGRDVRAGEWKPAEVEVLNTMGLLSAKPVIYLVNVSESDYLSKRNKFLAKIKGWVDEKSPGDLIIPFSATLEAKLADMADDAARADYLKASGATSALPKIIKTGYHALHLIHFFTCGTDEVKCWTVHAGAKAPEAAGTIHSDIEDGFVCAEVMPYESYKEHGSEGAVKAAGKWKQEGKNYIVNDGDIIYFRHAPTGGGGKKK